MTNEDVAALREFLAKYPTWHWFISHGENFYTFYAYPTPSEYGFRERKDATNTIAAAIRDVMRQIKDEKEKGE